jgi:hypothetical protein
MRECVSGLAENRRLSGGGIPLSLGVLVGVVGGGVKLVGFKLQHLHFFHT